VTSPWHSQGATITLAALAVACGIAIVVLLVLDVRRKEVSLAQAVGCVVVLGAVAGVTVGAPRIESLFYSRLAHYPQAVRETVELRLGILAFLVWLAVFSVVAVMGALGIAASFSILGPPGNRLSSFAPPPFQRGHWATLVRRSADIPWSVRIYLWARHALSNLAFFCGGVMGLLMAIGLPVHVGWAVLPLVFGRIIGPAGLDRRVADSLSHAECAAR